MARTCFYETLEVDRSASDGELKSAYRKAAMRWHPDRNPGDHEAEAKFKELNAAYDCLKDPQKRAAYDRFGHAAFENGGFGGRPGAGAGPDMSDFMSDIFESFFGDGRGRPNGGRSSSGRERGADLRYNMEISLEDAYAGKTAQIRIPTSVSCEACSGTGAKTGSKPRQCPTCGGAGKVRSSQGFFLMERTCPGCHGRGEIIDDPCKSCAGAGRVTKERTLEVAIPAGVEDGTRIRLAGEGEAGLRGGPTGDLYIFLSLTPHALFQRDGADLYCRAPIPMTTAALGGSFEAPTIDGGRTRVKIPEGTQSGMQFRLKGKGMPILRSKEFGDMYIQATVEIPQKLSARQRELLEQFAAEASEANHPETNGFFGRVKDFFGGA
ncbi:molecular chaperone DnaJ [Chelatococcus sambhunathii]|uniref:Chaperone protein DnaJ n=1 Tax=Chelatococcus sambhunathii TaxID=363953 RepID=A0ABU1DHX7_9HYPH|nr:molecular chaperone DnaJ [Chelatococcus sambhunathii]MDR4307711.1 molecular chaperone DnaJ [Chelatococcus sambhunathii]